VHSLFHTEENGEEVFYTTVQKGTPKGNWLILKMETHGTVVQKITVLPDRYSPLQSNRNGNQSLYLTELFQEFAEVLPGLIGEETRIMIAAVEVGAAVRRRIATGDDLGVWER